MELKQGSWVFYGFRMDDDETLCVLTSAQLMVEQQTVTIEYNKNNCSNKIFGDNKRFNEQTRQLNKALSTFMAQERVTKKIVEGNTAMQEVFHFQ